MLWILKPRIKSLSVIEVVLKTLLMVEINMIYLCQIIFAEVREIIYKIRFVSSELSILLLHYLKKNQMVGIEIQEIAIHFFLCWNGGYPNQSSTDEDGRLRTIQTSIRQCGQRDGPMNGGRRMDRWN